jgi:hypothetical protein
VLCLFDPITTVRSERTETWRVKSLHFCSSSSPRVCCQGSQDPWIGLSRVQSARSSVYVASRDVLLTEHRDDDVFWFLVGRAKKDWRSTEITVTGLSITTYLCKTIGTRLTTVCSCYDQKRMSLSMSPYSAIQKHPLHSYICTIGGIIHSPWR